jgi:heat shock protein HtpX
MANTLKTTVLLATLTGLFVLVGGALGGQSGMIIAFVFAIAMNMGAYWFSGDIALRMAGAHQIDRQQAPELYAIVDELASSAGLPLPRIAIMESDSPNAFATGRNPEHAVVAVTTGIMRILDRDELKGVLGHELGHVRNRDILISSIAATFAGAITMIAQMSQWSMMFGGFGNRSDDENRGGAGGLIGSLVLMLLAPIAAALIQMAVSRSREYGADETGARICGDPEALARALAKLERGSAAIPMNVNPAEAHLFIVNPLSGQALAGLFSTHPPIAERIARLRAMRLRQLT